MLLSRRLVVHGVASTWKSKGMFLSTAESKGMNWITCYATDDIEDLFKQVACDPFCHPNVERVNMGGLVDEFWSVIFQGFFMLGPFFFFFFISFVDRSYWMAVDMQLLQYEQRVQHSFCCSFGCFSGYFRRLLPVFIGKVIHLNYIRILHLSRWDIS